MNRSAASESTTRKPRDRGQTAVLGVVLVFGLVISATGLVLVYGNAAMQDTQSQSELERSEHSLTLFNSRASMVALGESPIQTVSFGDDGGDFESDSDSGWLRIKHTDYNGSGDDETVFNESLGAVVYENDGTQMVYQGGGVWRKGRHGETRMVSPPEFHYRGATLTLPIIRVTNDDDGSGGSTATVRKPSQSRRVFPNESGPTDGTNEVGAPYNGTDDDYVNPVANGTVNVTVKSEYYEGWAHYFRTRTDGEVKTFPDDQRVRVSLVSLAGSVGEFEMPAEGNAIQVRGMGDDHPINEYEFTLAADNSGRNFNNMHWSLYADEGSEQFELHFYATGKCNGDSYNGELDVSIYYYNTSGSNTIHEEWQATALDSSDYTADCSNYELTVDLMGSSLLTYDDVSLTGSGNKWHFGPEISDRSVAADTTSFGAHDLDDDGDYDGNYTTDDQTDLGFLVNHYLQLLGPGFDLTVTDGPGGSSRIDEGASTGTLEYDTSTGEQYITFMHVTENEVTVSFD